MQSFHSKPIGMQILHISKQGFTKKRHSLNNLSTSYEKFACWTLWKDNDNGMRKGRKKCSGHELRTSPSASSIRFESVKTCLVATAKSARILLKDSTESTILLQGDAVTKSKVQKRQIVRLRICHLRSKCCIHCCTYSMRVSTVTLDIDLFPENRPIIFYVCIPIEATTSLMCVEQWLIDISTNPPKKFDPARL